MDFETSCGVGLVINLLIGYLKGSYVYCLHSVLTMCWLYNSRVLLNVLSPRITKTAVTYLLMDSLIAYTVFITCFNVGEWMIDWYSSEVSYAMLRFPLLIQYVWNRPTLGEMCVKEIVFYFLVRYFGAIPIVSFDIARFVSGMFLAAYMILPEPFIRSFENGMIVYASQSILVSVLPKLFAFA